jgi:chromosome segregation ATPase
MSKGNMKGGKPQKEVTVQDLYKKKMSIQAKIEGIESTPERDAMMHEVNLLDIEIDHRKDAAYDAAALKNAPAEIRKEVASINDQLMENAKSRETLNHLNRKLSKEQDNLREKRTDLRFELGEMDKSDKAYSAKMSELRELEANIENMTQKMNSNSQRSRDIIRNNAELLAQKQDIFKKLK